MRSNVAISREHLLDAFESFQLASARLEERYEQLRQETEQLRGRLREKDAEIKRAERLSTLGEMAAALAHEVRNPLGAMRLFLSLLREDCGKAAPGSLELVGQLEQGIDSIETIVTNMLQFSRRKELALVPVNLHNLVQEHAASVEAARYTDLQVIVKCEGLPFINGDEHALRQVLRNLSRNAIEAMRGKGTLLFAVTRNATGNVRLTVEDSGPGILPEVAATMFEPFTTTKKEGTGLGLAVVRRIAEQHRAHVDAGARDGASGARVWIEFPPSEGEKL